MKRIGLLYLSVFIVATSGLIYELLAGTLASYVLGDSVTQFSTCIGAYLFALGIGAWLSGFVDKSLARMFIEIEFAVALVGGFSAPLLFVCFAKLTMFRVALYGVVLAVGILVGLELPLLMRILRDRLQFKDLVSRVLTFDYIGALAASLAFPLFLVPTLGLVRTSLMFGILNGMVGMWGTWVLDREISGSLLFLRLRGVGVLLLLTIGLIKADSFTTWVEDQLYDQPVVYSATSSYQRIVVTQGGEVFRLFLDGNLQFNSADEYRYHEALVHPAMAAAGQQQRVLVLGGGDGLAVREILKHQAVEHVTLVDLDPAMTQLPDHFPPLGQLNQNALHDPRVNVLNDDAFLWLMRSRSRFDVIIVDFPDPNNLALGKLYTRRFYQMLLRHLNPGGAIAVQATSPLVAPNTYWCIVNTMQAAGWKTLPYQTAVPSFGVWGFVLAKAEPLTPPQNAPTGLRFLNEQTLAALFALPNDSQPRETGVNRLDNQLLVRYYSLDTGGL
ncbi:polyamine aminopropyltransferase [Lignipirellula cremea]|uniref:Polyamine aminopropyltransferase n=1 Tax=Lignipirellula cremea TaxID=2528010 RepID=A0A518DZX6_9BACT|nr:polyamine aminopropyltransferase [Lignipirellula cremea]QDU97389.1 Spermidine synthase [Lignipirellula cremea]